MSTRLALKKSYFLFMGHMNNSCNEHEVGFFLSSFLFMGHKP